MADIKRVTKRENFEEVIKIAEGLGRTDIIEFAQHEIELLDKKASSKTTTKTQKENEGIKTVIKDFLNATPNEMFTITQLQEKITDLADFSNQKISALVNQLYKANEIDKVIDKKKSYFKALAD